MYEHPTYRCRGDLIEESVAVKYPIVAAGPGLTDDNIVEIFETEDEFLQWSSKTTLAAKIADLTKKTSEARSYQGRDLENTRNRKKKVVDRLAEDMNELAARLGLDPSSEEVFLEATIESDVLEGSIFDPVTRDRT